jgi:hypothetical protein
MHISSTCSLSTLCTLRKLGLCTCRACGLSRSMKIVFHAWRKVLVTVRETESSSRQWHRHFRLRSCFAALSQHAQACKHSQAVTGQQNLALQLRALTAWKASLLMHQCAMTKADVWRRRIVRRLLVQTFRKWVCLARQRVVYISLVMRLQGKWAQRVCTAVLRCWLARIASSRQWCRAWAHVGSLVGLQLQKDCMRAWWKLCTVVRLMRSQAAYMHKTHARQFMKTVFSGWQHAVSQGQMIRQRYIQASSSRLLRLLARVWEAWQVVWMQGKHRRRAIAAEHSQRQQRCLAAAFRAWLHCTSLQKYQCQLLQGVLSNIIHLDVPHARGSDSFQRKRIQPLPSSQL